MYDGKCDRAADRILEKRSHLIRKMCPGNRADRMQEGMRLILPPDSSSNGLLFHRMEATQKFLRCLGKRELLIVCDDQRTLRHLFVHIQGEDTVRFFGDTVIRNKCNSESDACKSIRRSLLVSSISGTRSN